MSESEFQPDFQEIYPKENAQEIEKLIEKQSARKRILELTDEDARWKRSNTLHPECVITSKEIPGKVYQVEKLTDPEQPEVEAFQELLETTFRPEDIESLQRTKELIQAEKDGIAKDHHYILKDKEKVIAIYTAGSYPLLDEQGKDTGEMQMFGGYAVTVPEYTRQGLMRELYTSALVGASIDAANQKKDLIGVIGETTSASQKTWESVKRKRVYAEDHLPDGSIKRIEVPYIHPALEFDMNGNPAQGAGEGAEHIMIDYFKDEPLPKDKLENMIRAIYKAGSILPKKKYIGEGRSEEDVEAAYQNNVDYVKGFEQKIKDFLNSHGELTLMNSSEVELAQQQGIVVETYDVPDKQDKESGAR